MNRTFIMNDLEALDAPEGIASLSSGPVEGHGMVQLGGQKQ